jgi:hypothetical protein
MSWTTNLRLTVLFYPTTYKIRTSCLLPKVVLYLVYHVVMPCPNESVTNP